MSDSTHTVTVRAFDSAYPGSMFDKPHGEYVERGDASSLAAALLELVAKHKRDAEDFEDALKQEKAERDALRAEFERLATQADKQAVVLTPGDVLLAKVYELMLKGEISLTNGSGGGSWSLPDQIDAYLNPNSKEA